LPIDAAGSGTTGSKRRRTQEEGHGDEKEGQADNSSPIKPQRATKKKGSKKQGGAEKGALSHSLMKVVGNPDFFVQIFVEEGWLPKVCR
jgi:hypothetical protein